MRTVAIALAAALSFGSAAWAQDVNGTWQTEPSDAGGYLQVRIGPCSYDQTLTCGQIVKAVNSTIPDLEGRAIITDMKPNGENRWNGGQIWAPDDDKTYRSKMALTAAGLKVEGCVAIFCRGQTWQRVAN